MASTDVALSPLGPDTTEAAWLRVAKPKARGTKWWFSIRAGDALLGGLRFDRLFRTDATADAAGGRWTFRHLGWTRRRFSITRDTQVIAQFDKPGTLTLEGVPFGWRHTSPADAEYGWFEADRLLLTMRPRATGPALAEARLAAPTHPQLPLLMLFGFYLFLLAENDTAVVRLRIP